MPLAFARRARRLITLLCLAAATTAHADIVIGQVAPFTGPQAVTGKAIRAGAKLWLDDVNARGGVRGQKIKLVGTGSSGWSSRSSILSNSCRISGKCKQSCRK